jgi:hypothetical protein
VYLFLALFWLGIGILLQVFWESISEFAHIPVNRTSVGVFCLILMSYNFLRWRLSQGTVHRARPMETRRESREYDPNFDFTRADRDEPDKPKSAD